MRHVMVVDDDASVRYTVQAVLDLPDIEVVCAASGWECVEALDRGFEGLILLDVMMPNMDGWQTIQQIVERGYAGSVIICMLTAKPVPDAEMEPFKPYVLDYVTKPFHADELVGLVRGYLEFLPGMGMAA